MSLSLANAGHRLSASLIDLIIQGIYVFLVVLTFSGPDSISEKDGALFWYILISLPITLYFPIMEYFWNGRSPGKYFLKLMVVRKDGSAATLSDIILRWLLRIIDVKVGFLFIFFIPRNPSSQLEEILTIWTYILMLFPMPIVGLAFMVSTKSNQRLGDLVANTIVIRLTQTYSLEDTILKLTEEDYQPRFTNVLQLKDKDIYIIKKVLTDQKANGDYSKVNELAVKAKEILGIEDEILPLELLKTLIKDYNHLARERDLANA